MHLVLSFCKVDQARLHAEWAIAKVFTNKFAIYAQGKTVITAYHKAIGVRIFHGDFMVNIDKKIIRIIGYISQLGVTEPAFMLQVQYVHPDFAGVFYVALLVNIGDAHAIFTDYQFNNVVHGDGNDSVDDKQAHK